MLSEFFVSKCLCTWLLLERQVILVQVQTSLVWRACPFIDRSFVLNQRHSHDCRTFTPMFTSLVFYCLYNHILKVLREWITECSIWCGSTYSDLSRSSNHNSNKFSRPLNNFACFVFDNCDLSCLGHVVVRRFNNSHADLVFCLQQQHCLCST